MAMVVSSSISGEEKARRSSFRAEKQPWMLRDYLRDDMSSCSSSGFRSFPRRQCCVAVRNIIEKEVIRGGAGGGGRKPKRRPPTTTKCFGRNRTISSALQRASVAVINAVKLLPFRTPAADGGGGGGGGAEGNWLLPRSFSKKLFKRSFWKRKSSSLAVGGGGGERKVAAVVKKEEECDEIERWISSGVAGVEKYQPLDLSNDTTASSNSNTNSDGKSDSWSDITFTSDCLTTSSENDAVDRRENSVEEEVSKRGGVTATGDDSGSPAVTKSVWCNEKAEKEQYSPISILDFPENDQENDQGSSSPFTCRVTRLKGTKQRLMDKLERFQSFTRLGLEPVNLESLISFTETEDPSPKFSVQSCSTTSYIISSEDEDEDEDEDEEDDDIGYVDVNCHEEEVEESQISEIERKAEHLLNKLKDTIPTKTTYNYKFEQDKLLLDFFGENITDKDDIILLKAAEDWLNGQYDKSILGWEVKDKRQAYIRDMEEKGRWPRDTKLEKEEVATELGAEVVSCLIEELLLECCSS